MHGVAYLILVQVGEQVIQLQAIDLGQNPGGLWDKVRAGSPVSDRVLAYHASG
jgi:hypothetical protein